MSKYPNSFDTEHDLYMVRDSLDVVLQKDYHPGDTAVFIDGDISLFPPSGIITLTDQVSKPDERSISLRYAKKSQDSFWGIEIMPDSKDIIKPKKLTSVSMQLRAEHHNSIVDSIKAIQNTLGTRKNVDKTPFGSTLMGRANFLINMIYTPKAWFEVNKVLGLAPFTVEFTSLSQGVSGPVGEVDYEWNFGDGTNLKIKDRTITKTYMSPGIYDVTLTVTNAYGSDTVKLHNLIKVRIKAPEEAIINFVPQSGQIFTPGFPETGPYEQPPKLRTPVGQLISLGIMSGENPHNVNVSYAGEVLDSVSKKPIDAITNYTWVLSDDLPHANAPNTQAAYAIGGLHDLTLRVDTQFGAYRITNYENCIDSVEIKNLWLWTTQNKITRAFELGINNETFKTRKTVPLTLQKNDSFLNDVPNSKKQKKEFNRNCGVAPINEPSGLQGSCLLFWASGRDKNASVAMEQIHFSEYNAFTDTYENTTSSIDRPWNWAALISPVSVYFILGGATRQPPSMSPTNSEKQEVYLESKHVKNDEFAGYNFLNGAQEVQHNSTVFNDNGKTTQGHFSMYRTTWKDNTGYMVRSVWQNDSFVLKNFYKTYGTISSPFVSLVKLLDLPNGGLKEGQLASLSNGIYFFSNMGAALGYKDDTGTWEIAGGGNPGLFRMLQDNSVAGYDNEENSLLVASDGDRKAFLSFDYSNKAFIKFNETDFTFSTLGARPIGEQWQIAAY